MFSKAQYLLRPAGLERSVYSGLLSVHDEAKAFLSNLNMTVITDNEKRVVLPQAQPGECFDVQVCANGFVLRKLKAKVT